MIHELVAHIVVRFWPLFAAAAAVDVATWAAASHLRARRARRFLVELPPPGSH